MTRRWLVGLFLFALGFGSSALVQRATASSRKTAAAGGLIEGGLSYVDSPTDLTFQYTAGDATYLVVESRVPGAAPVDGPILVQSGTVKIPKFRMQSLTIYRLSLVASADGGRVCIPPDLIGECPTEMPLPPRPPLQPLDLTNHFLFPEQPLTSGGGNGGL